MDLKEEATVVTGEEEKYEEIVYLKTRNLISVN